MNRLHHWYCRTGHWQRTVARDLLGWTLDGAPLGDHLLELGAGSGTVTAHLRRLVPNVTALDVDDESLRELRQRNQPETPSNADAAAAHRVRAVCASATTLPFAQHTFSSAATFMMLHHVDDIGRQRALLQEVHRVLRPGGVFAGCEALPTISMHLFHLGDVFQPVTAAGLAPALRTAGFEDIDVSTTGRYLRWRARRPPTSQTPPRRITSMRERPSRTDARWA